MLVYFSVVSLVVAGGVFTTSAQESGLDGLTVWDGAFTEEQAERGSITYGSNCSGCHGDAGVGTNRASSLTGDAWMGNFQTQTVDDLFMFIRTNMPLNDEGSLSNFQYLDLAAFILSINDIPAGETELTLTSGVGVTIIPEDGELVALQDSTLIRVVGCLVEGGDSGWFVNNATAPRRLSRAAGVGPEDASAALGDGTFPLLFVLLPLDDYIGHRVSVSGLTQGEGGTDGINVAIVESVSETCE
jgi:hypothetical protein